MTMLVLAVGAAVALSACSTQGGQNLAEEACVHVHISVADYLRAVNPKTSAGTSAQLEKEADEQLRDALPLAAAANSDDGSWNSLMTTISESATVDEGHLIPALRAQCTVANANPNVNPQAPSGGSGNSGAPGGGSNASTTQPQNVNPEPASPSG